VKDEDVNKTKMGSELSLGLSEVSRAKALAGRQRNLPSLQEERESCILIVFFGRNVDFFSLLEKNLHIQPNKMNVYSTSFNSAPQKGHQRGSL
jgi:hypothetical protein